MRSYDEMYLYDAMRNLGEAVDFAVSACGIDMEVFLTMFEAVGIAEQFGKGNPKYVSGMSGTELTCEVLSKANYIMDIPEPQTEYSYSAEYWCGWILAYYQWYSGNSFRNILRKVKAETLMRMYPALHEASEEKALEMLDGVIVRDHVEFRIQQQRRINGISQSLLAQKSGVNVRTLQQYEIGAKNINHASVGTVYRLASVLGCRPEDIMEPEAGSDS